MTRSEQAEKRRGDILYTALDLFIRKGYGSTRIEDIAQAVGMSKGLLFHYFESKEALHAELMRLGALGPEMMFEQSKAAAETMEFFEMAAKRTMELIEADTFTARMFIFMTQSFYGDASLVSNSTSFNAIYATVPLIEKGQKEGVIRDGDPLALSLAFWGAITGMAQMKAYSSELPCPNGEWFADILRKKV